MFLNTQTWDSHANASPEGPGTTPSEKYPRWPNTGPLATAMRLTALRQSPTDTSRHPTNSGHLKSTPEPPNGSCPQFPCDSIPIYANTKKCGSAGLHDAPYGGATRAPCRPAYSNPLPKPIALNAETCKNHMLSNATTNTIFPKSHYSRIPIVRLEHLARGGMAAGCGLGTEGRQTRNLSPTMHSI